MRFEIPYSGFKGYDNSREADLPVGEAEMKYSRFGEVPVWQAGIDLSTRISALTEDPAFRRRGDIANRLQRAALSVPDNVARGFERGTTRQLITLPYYARGSAGEVRSTLCVVERIPASTSSNPQFQI